MSLLMTVFFENGFSEHYFPAVDNRKHPIAVSPYISGLDDELVLNVEVWDGKWTISPDKKYDLLKGGEAVGSAVLENGLVLEGTVKKNETWFSIKVDEVGENSTCFSKYILRRDKIQSLVIGSGSNCDIVYANRFVSERHADILFEGANTYLVDNGSTNGTYLNGRAVTQKTPVLYGDVIYVVGLKIVYLGQLIAINNPLDSVKVKLLDPVVIPEITDETEEDEYEKVYFLRTPRQLRALDTDPISVERCSQQQPYKSQPLIFTIGPSFTMVIPIALAAVMSSEGGFGASSLVMSGGAAVMAAIWAVANNKYNKSEANKSEQTRKTTYIDYINRIEKKLVDKAEHNRSVLLEQYPSADEMLSFIGAKQARLWEKSSVHRDFLSVRLGIGDIKAPNGLTLPNEDLVAGYDPLNELPDKLKNEFGTLKQVPVSVSLYDNRIVGVVSPDAAKRNALLRLLTLNLTANFPYNELRLCYAFQAKEYDELSFLRWLPHTWAPDGKLRLVAYDARSLGDVLYFLSDLFRDRMEKEKEKSADKTEKVLPHYVIFITDVSLIAGEPIAKFLLDPPQEAGVTVVFCADSTERLPSKCDTVISDENGIAKVYNISTQESYSSSLAVDNVSLPAMDYFARNLANFELRDTSGNSEIPDMLTFLDMYKVSKVEDLDIYHRWLENRTYETMKAMVGQKSGGKPVYLDIHEKYHGPHGLVAGTTGSGKSETLQSYILSMAINYHPHEVAFILIDYKGGGMAQSFEGLPHLAGMITNLGGNGTTRALLSINAEIKHRQRVFNDYKIKHIDQYIELYRNGEADEPMPHLIIIADEFAELKKEQPEFVRALVSAARVGRSLGVNLILATQKPGGVVDDEIWSNTRFRICLRVADKQDSNEMLKRPDAAYITGTGRGYMQVGNDEIFEEFQSGWSGAEYTPDVPFDDGSKGFVRMVGITGKPEKIGNKKKKKSGDNLNKVTQLDEIVKYAGKLSAENNIEPLRQIWLAPLPSMLYLDDLDTEGLNKEHLAIPIGLADDPENQRQFTVSLDFIRDGHLLICGASGAGKTTLIETIVFSAAQTYTADQVNFYIADFSGRTMSAFSGLPHTGAVCLEGEDEEIENVMNFIKDELERRKITMSQKGIGSFRDYLAVENDLPMILLIIDNYAAFNESYEEYDDLFVQLSREAAGYGIYLIFSCNNSSDIRGRIRQGFTKGIGMQLPDRFEYDSVIGTRTEILPDDRVSGRGLIKEGNPLEFQTALPVRSTGLSIMLTIREIIAEKFAGVEGISNKSLNKYSSFSTDEVLNGTLSPDKLILGKNINDGSTVSAELDKTLVYTVSGGPKSGKTNFLAFAAKQMKEMGSRVYIFDGPLREMEDVATEINADGYITNQEDLFGFMEQIMVPELTERNELVYNAREAKTSVSKALKDYDRIALIVNSAVDFMEAIYNEAADMSEFLEIVFEKGMEHKIHFIMGVSFREYDECSSYNAFRMAMDMKTGLHLGGRLAEQRIFDFDISVGEYDRSSPAGSAVTVVDGETVEVMTPLMS